MISFVFSDAALDGTNRVSAITLTMVSNGALLCAESLSLVSFKEVESRAILMHD